MIEVNAKTYLGDGLYASHDGSKIRIASENGLQVLNEVFLEDDVLQNLLRYIERIYRVKVTIAPREEETES